MLIPCKHVYKYIIIMLQVTILSSTTRNKPIVKDVISPPTVCRVSCVRLSVVVAVVAYFNNGAKVVL